MLTFPEGHEYEGMFNNDMAHGHGRIIMIDGSYYDGWWVAGKRDGYGLQVNSKGEKLIGLWKNNLMHGKGREEWADSTTFEG
jgi:hypothetical protein